jgi:hypothetical protein
MVFRVSEDFYKKLALKLSDLRDKRVVHMPADDIQAMEVRNATGSISLSRSKDSSFDWVFAAPADQKDKSASGWKLLDPVTGLSAEDVIDHPAANLLAQIANPEATVVLSDKSGKALTVRFSKPAAKFVEAQASDTNALYKLKKDALDSLNLKASDLAP